MASPFSCGLADEAQLVGNQQQDEQPDGQGDTDGECFRGAVILSFVFEHIEQRREQAGQDQQQHEDDENFGQHRELLEGGDADYAVPCGMAQSMSYVFRPQLFPTLVAIVLVAGMVKLGFWQYGKAEQKKALQAIFDARLTEPPVALPERVFDPGPWRYRRIRATGHYEPRFQILLDNQVENGRAGYHVITPFRAHDTDMVLLIDRGWVPVGDRSQLPSIDTPQGEVEVMGHAWVPSGKYYELAPPPATPGWQAVWENLDLARYAKASQLVVFPFVLRLDASSQAGGFVRNWVRPAERIETHIGYAWQWWGFAVAVVGIWLFVGFKRVAP